MERASGRVLCFGVLADHAGCNLAGGVGAPEMVADGRFQLGVVAAGLVVVMLVRRSWRSAAVVGLAGALHLGPVLALEFGSRTDVARVEASLKVASCNLWYGNSDVAAFQSFVDQVAPDVIVLLEVSPLFYAAISKMEGQYPHQQFAELGLPASKQTRFGMGLVSKHPIRDFLVVSELADALPYLRCTLDVRGDEIDLFIVHAMTPQRGAERGAYLASVADAVDPARSTLVLGDFNATLYSQAFKSFRDDSGLVDTRNGFGRQPTWAPRRWPLPLGFDIDHILASRDLKVIAREVGPPIGSDHRPVQATLAIQR